MHVLEVITALVHFVTDNQSVTEGYMVDVVGLKLNRPHDMVRLAPDGRMVSRTPVTLLALVTMVWQISWPGRGAC